MPQLPPKFIVWLFLMVFGLVIFSVIVGLCAAYITHPEQFWNAIKSCC